MLRFDWDERKNKRNRRKHGVWFEEAQSVFDDPHGRLFYDPEHSEEEERRSLLQGVRVADSDYLRSEGNQERSAIL